MTPSSKIASKLTCSGLRGPEAQPASAGAAATAGKVKEVILMPVLLNATDDDRATGRHREHPQAG